MGSAGNVVDRSTSVEAGHYESKELVWRSPGGSEAANLIVSISPMDQVFRRHQHQGFYDGAKSRMKNGEVDEVKWVEIDGLKAFSSRSES